MVQLGVARAANLALVKTQPLVAVFIGGTTGIGEYSLRALASTHADQGNGLRIYIIGRRKVAADKIISDCQVLCPQGQFTFVSADDLSLLKNVDRVCAEITYQEQKQAADGGGPRIDMLVMSQGVLHFGPRKETTEGLDMSTSLLYYSRVRFLTKLLPLLLASPLPAHIVSVYAAGLEASGKLFSGDLSLRDPKHYGFGNVRTHVIHMKTMFFEHLAKQHPGKLSLIHVFPSLVVTPGFEHDTYPAWFKISWKLAGPFVKRFFSVSAEEIGPRIIFLTTSRYPARSASDTQASEKLTKGEAGVAVSTDGVSGGGAYSVNYDGETYAVEKHYTELRKQDFEKKVWEHTMGAFAAIESGQVFKD